jgi:translation initiation factor 2 alpha subunit (eIF-2alpha)
MESVVVVVLVEVEEVGAFFATQEYQSIEALILTH